MAIAVDQQQTSYLQVTFGLGNGVCFQIVGGDAPGLDRTEPLLRVVATQKSGADGATGAGVELEV
jgi:6-phosphogluconate dehydrogenase (decarboxylating)